MISTRSALRRSFVTASFALVAVSWSAGAQNSTGKPVVIAPVEVIATRIPEAPHDVPVSVEVISGDDLRARGAATLKDALALAAGVAIAPGGDGGPAGAVAEFWGLREMDAFLLVVDGVPLGGAFNPAVASLSLRDVERIEVLRGPAPVTYGATSFSGVIHVVHKSAAENLRYLNARTGSFASGGAAADFAFTPTGDWKSRVSADVDRQRFSDARTGFTRGHALVRSAKTGLERKVWLTGEATFLGQAPASPHPREGPALATAVPLDANHNPAGAYLDENRFAVSAGLERSAIGGSLWGSTASISRSEQKIFRGFLTDVSNTPKNASGFRENIEVIDLYADSHLIWSPRPAIRLMTGADLLFANGEARGATFDYTAPLSGTPAPVVTEPTLLDKDAGDRRIFAGAYGSAEWRASARLSVSGGLRLNSTSERRGEGETVSHTRPSGSLGAIVRLWERGADHARLFANFRHTFKPAAFDFNLAEDEGVLDPETSKSYEAGLKTRLMDGRAGFEASVFRMDFTNLVTSTVVNKLPALVNSGKTRFKGIELASDIRLVDAVHARATYSFHDGKFVDFVQAFGGTPTQLAGKRFEMSARHLASAGVTLSPDAGLIASASVNYTGDRYLNKRNTALAPAFTTLDAGVGFRSGNAEMRLDGRNLGGRRDPVSESEIGDAQYYRMPSRTIQLSVGLRY